MKCTYVLIWQFDFYESIKNTQICTQEACIGKTIWILCNNKILEKNSIFFKGGKGYKIIEHSDIVILSNY